MRRSWEMSPLENREQASKHLEMVRTIDPSDMPDLLDDGDREQFSRYMDLAVPQKKSSCDLAEFANIPRAEGNARCWGYARVSTMMQYDKENSIPSQVMRMENYYNLNLQPRGIELCGIVDDGKAMSARSTPFMGRPGAREILSQLRVGDHLIFDKFDRVFRDVRDFLHCADWFRRNRISMHILNLGGQQVESDTPMGKLFMLMLAGLAQFEAEVTSARIREAFFAKRTQGTSAEPHVPLGAKLEMVPRPGKTPKKRLVWDKQEREIMAMVLYMRDEMFMKWCDIARMLRSLCIDPNPGKRTLAEKEKYLKILEGRCYWWYGHEYFYRAAGITSPSMVPSAKVIKKAASWHKKVMTRTINIARREYRLANGQRMSRRILKPLC